MGNPFSMSCDPCVNRCFQCLEENVSYTHNLKKNLTALESTLKDLSAKREDLLSKITREEDRGMQRLAEIKVWLTKAETIEKRIIDLLRVGDNQLQKLCLCGFCSKSLKSSYCYGKNVFLTLKEAEELKSRVFEEIVDKPQTSKVQEIPLQPTIVGQETMLNKAWNSFKDDEVGIMGLYGMGGVGKTTLLTQMNNKLTEERCGFDYVIWVVVSKELHVEMIQDKIALKLGLAGEQWNQKCRSQKSVDILNFLRPKRFVLFLDDIWEKVDLAEIGVPFPTPQNKCKVAFTSRSQAVCAQMGVKNPMEVEILNEYEAFDLFKKKVGNITLESDPDVPNLARIVASKCCGLPLALNVIGETMSCKTTVQEWHDAIEDLASNFSEIDGMEDKILRLLKYSYDNLRGEKVKSCLLYCALFPEDHIIDKERLINYWIGQGIIDGSEDIEKAENKGYGIIGNLVRASLLMDVVNKFGAPAVVIHDVVREMALWIACDLGKEKEAFIVHAGVGLDKLPVVKNWKDVRRMSLMNSNIKHLVGSPECLELTTLLLQNANLETISNDFFKSMPKLVVLDLSDNKTLSELPDGIWELGSLKYLNLSDTGIRHLSKGIQELKKLIHLVFGDRILPSSIAGISNLHSLKILDYSSHGSSWDCEIVEELESLEHLQILNIIIRSPEIPVMEKFFSSRRLTKCTRDLTIQYMGLKSSGMTIPVTMNKLRHFNIFGGTISEIKMGNICIKSKTVSPQHNLRNPCFSSLSIVHIFNCKGLRELTLLMFAPKLKELHVRVVRHLEDIINKEKACEGEESRIVPFPKLIVLRLKMLPKLKSIYWSPLRFPYLKTIEVAYCPKLKKLPVDSQSGENGLVLRYDDESWLEGLEWEDEATKSLFLSSSKKGLL